jgi:hypothetical protein
MNELQKIVYIDSNYILFLQDKYSDIYWNKEIITSNNETISRPYVGFILKIKGVEFFAPLTSKKKKEGYGFLPVINKGEIISFINLQKMIPVNEELTRRINFNINNNDDIKTKKYKTYLFHEWRFISRNRNKILEEAKEMFESNKKYYLELIKYSLGYKKK